MEEIDEVDCNFGNPFYADAVANEKETNLSKDLKINFKKVWIHILGYTCFSFVIAGHVLYISFFLWVSKVSSE